MLFRHLKGNDKIRSGYVLGMIFSLCCIAPAEALSDDRFDRIEKALEAMQQKIETLSMENRQLRQQVDMLSGSKETIVKKSDTPDNKPTHNVAVKTTSIPDKTSVDTTATKLLFSNESAQHAADTGFDMRQFQERVRDLEAGQEEVISRLDSSVKVGGYASVEYYFTDEQNQNSSFRVRHFSLFFSKAIQDEWELFTEVEFEDAPFIEAAHANPANNTVATVQGKFLVEQMYVKYHPSVRWDLVTGRFLTPAGLWNVYHYYPYVPTQQRPFMVRVLYPQWSDGLQLRYALTPSFGLIDTHLYVANGAGNPGRLDRNVSKALGAKINFIPNLHSDVQIGASIYREKDNFNVIRTTYGTHLMARVNNLGLQTEFAHRQNSPLGALKFSDYSIYAQLTYDFDKWTVAGRYDWYNDNSLLVQSNRYRYTGAINYHFAHNVVGKIEYNRNKFDNPAIKDFHEVIAAISVAIGDF